jgi:hypothetical protein
MRASGYDRAAEDYYVEPAWAVELLLDREHFPTGVWDPCCGSGTIPKACLARKIPALGSDIADRPYGAGGMDFFAFKPSTARSIVSNPPYDVLQEFIDHALAVSTGKVAVIARLAFLASMKRKNWFESGSLARLWTMSRRPSMPPGGTNVPAKGGSIDYAWFVWDRAHVGAPELGWIG